MMKRQYHCAFLVLVLLAGFAQAQGKSWAAIEVVKNRDGQYYIAGYGGFGVGIWVAKLNWRAPTVSERSVKGAAK